jgi:hypothetical protein
MPEIPFEIPDGAIYYPLPLKNPDLAYRIIEEFERCRIAANNHWRGGADPEVDAGGSESKGGGFEEGTGTCVHARPVTPEGRRGIPTTLNICLLPSHLR